MQPTHNSPKKRFEPVSRPGNNPNAQERVITAQDISEIYNFLKTVSNNVGTVSNAVGADQNGDPNAESHDLTQTWRDRDVDSNSALSAQGFDQGDQQSMVGQLAAGGVNQAQAPAFLSNLAALAHESGQNVAQILPTAYAMLRREPGNTQRVMDSLRVLARYQQDFPNIGIYDVAQDAASGKDVSQDLLGLRLAISSKYGLGGGSDLEAAIMGQALPASALTQSVDALNVERNKRMQQQVGLIYDATLIKNLYFISSEKQQQGIYQWLDAKLPGLAKSPAGVQVMRLLTSIATAHAAWQTVQATAGIGKGGGQLANQLIGSPSRNPYFSAPSPMGGSQLHSSRTPSVYDLRFAATPGHLRHFAQTTPGIAPTLTSAPLSTGAEVAPTANAQMNQASSAINTANPSQTQNEHGVTAPGTQQTINQNFTTDSLENKARNSEVDAERALQGLQTQRNNILALLGSLGATGDNISQPYMTPQQVAAQAQALESNATTAMGMITSAVADIQRLIPLYRNRSNDGSTGEAVNQAMSSLQAIQVSIQSMRLEATALAITMPVEQEIKNYQTRKDEAMRQFQRSQRMWGLGNNSAFSYVSQINVYLAQLRRDAAQKYQNLASQASDASMRQWASNAANEQGAKAQQLLDEISDMEYQQAGDLFGMGGGTGIGNGALDAVNASLARRTRFVLSEDGQTAEVVEADKELEDYWNALLPGYGTELEHPEHLKKHHHHEKKASSANMDDAEGPIVEADKELQDYWNGLLPGYGDDLEHPTPVLRKTSASKFVRLRQK